MKALVYNTPDGWNCDKCPLRRFARWTIALRWAQEHGYARVTVMFQ